MPLDTTKGDDFETFLVSLAETIEWVGRLAPLQTPARDLRQAVTRPPYFSNRHSTVDWLRQVRANELRQASPADIQPASNLADGRLLIFLPDDNAFDGAAELATNGYFDSHNVP